MEAGRDLIERVTRRVLLSLEGDPRLVVAGVSNRHVHLCPRHVEALFGPGHRLERMKDLRQPGQYACRETLLAATAGGVLEGVRVLGPERERSQFELSLSDARRLRISPPLAKSGAEGACPSVTLVGPSGSVVLDSGVALAWRHVHLSPEEGASLGLKDGDEIDVEAGSDRGVLFRRVWVRVHRAFVGEFHLDVDEANACGLITGEVVRLCV